nr:MAG TPA: hypothetical protein [Caudoviricetes sp.]
MRFLARATSTHGRTASSAMRSSAQSAKEVRDRRG